MILLKPYFLLSFWEKANHFEIPLDWLPVNSSLQSGCGTSSLPFLELGSGKLCCALNELAISLYLMRPSPPNPHFSCRSSFPYLYRGIFLKWTLFFVSYKILWYSISEPIPWIWSVLIPSGIYQVANRLKPFRSCQDPYYCVGFSWGKAE